MRRTKPTLHSDELLELLLDMGLNPYNQWGLPTIAIAAQEYFPDRHNDPTEWSRLEAEVNKLREEMR